MNDVSIDRDSHPQGADGSNCPDQDGSLRQLGTLLREARQDRGLERKVLAGRLCMGEEQLKALEEGNRDQLPEPVFVIAQARRVADALGIDISASITQLKQTSSRGHRPGTSPRPGSPAAATRVGRPGIGVIGAAGLLGSLALAAGGAWAWKTWHASGPAAHHAAPPQHSAAAANSPAITATTLHLSSAEPSWLEVRSSSGDRVLFKGSFKGRRDFPLGSGLRLLAGRPDLVRAGLGTAEAQPLGPIDQVRWWSFAPPQAAEAPERTLKPSRPAAQAPAP